MHCLMRPLRHHLAATKAFAQVQQVSFIVPAANPFARIHRAEHTQVVSFSSEVRDFFSPYLMASGYLSEMQLPKKLTFQ